MYDSMYPQMKIIETKRCILRPANINDAQDIFEYYKEEKVVKYLPFKKHENIEDTKRFIESFFIKHYKNNEVGHYVILYKDNKKVIGNIGFNNLKKKSKYGEIGICINPYYWGKGITEELLTEIIKLGFDDLGLSKIVAITFKDNKYSRKSLEEFGFNYLGLNKKKISKNKYYLCHKYELLKLNYIQ